ncbi:MAG: hypothetical protein ACYS5F_13750 [Planctomycetota bacterium]
MKNKHRFSVMITRRMEFLSILELPHYGPIWWDWRGYPTIRMN